jgi:heptaprenyl diphosphate synthase
MGLVLPLYYNKKITLLSVSILGAAVFNIVQLAIASILVHNVLLFRGYLPFLLLLAIPTGFFTGLAAMYLEKAVRRSGFKFNTR